MAYSPRVSVALHLFYQARSRTSTLRHPRGSLVVHGLQKEGIGVTAAWAPYNQPGPDCRQSVDAATYIGGPHSESTFRKRDSTAAVPLPCTPPPLPPSLHADMQACTPQPAPPPNHSHWWHVSHGMRMMMGP